MSSAQAIAYHSMTFTPIDSTSTTRSINTWDDWHLVPTSRPTFAMPPVKTNYVDIPGSDGILDLTTALTGRPTYGNRQGSFEFLVMNDYGDWATRYSNIATYLHGKEFQCVLDDDTTYYYDGRFSVSEWRSEKDWSKIVINYSVSPFKKSLLAPGERWLWDPFQFSGTSTGHGTLISSYKNKVLDDETLVLTYTADVYESIPIFTGKKYNNTFNMTLTYNSVNYKLKTGINKFDAIQLTAGTHEFIFRGTGKISIDTTGGRL